MTTSLGVENNYSPQYTQQKNFIGLTQNGQKVLNKTNPQANTYNTGVAAVNAENKKENLINAGKNTLFMPVMSAPFVSTFYAINQCNKGEISQEDAIKIMTYNAISRSFFDK